MSQYPIVLISGWAMPAGTMESLAEALDADHRRVSIIQLPGLVSELDDYRTPYDWKVLLDYLDQQLFEKPAILVGWSLGGMLATLYASRHPEHVAGVINMSSNVCFVQRSEWPEAMSPALFASFSEGLAESVGKTLRQFVLLCASGSAERKAHIAALQSLIDDAELDNNTLQELLAILGNSDLRSALSDIRCPITHLFGESDGLVPASAANLIEAHYPQHRVQVFKGGHNFFMDDPQAVVREVHQLCLRIP